MRQYLPVALAYLLMGCAAPPVGMPDSLPPVPVVTVLQVQDERPDICIYFMPPIVPKQCFKRSYHHEEADYLTAGF